MHKKINKTIIKKNSIRCIPTLSKCQNIQNKPATTAISDTFQKNFYHSSMLQWINHYYIVIFRRLLLHMIHRQFVLDSRCAN